MRERENVGGEGRAGAACSWYKGDGGGAGGSRGEQRKEKVGFKTDKLALELAAVSYSFFQALFVCAKEKKSGLRKQTFGKVRISTAACSSHTKPGGKVGLVAFGEVDLGRD